MLTSHNWRENHLRKALDAFIDPSEEAKNPHQLTWEPWQARQATTIIKERAKWDRYLAKLEAETLLELEQEQAAIQEAGSGGDAAAAAGGNTPGVEPSNTTPATRTLRLAKASIDTLHVSLKCRNQTKLWQWLKRELEKAKTSRQAGGAGTVETPDGDRLHVEPSGWRHANGDLCPWVVKYKGCSIHIGENQDGLGERPNIYIVITSLPLLAREGLSTYYEIIEVLHSLNFEVVWDKVTRVDVCVDLPGVSVSEFAIRAMHGQYVGRTTGETIYRERRKITGCDLSTEHARIRCYDKIEETKNQPEKRALMISRRWFGKTPDHATRVEFQFRREFLTKRDIFTVRELLDSMRALTTYATSAWCRFIDTTDADKVRKGRNQDKAKICKVWQCVQESFAQWDIATGSRPIGSPPRYQPSYRVLVDQILGCMSSLAVRMGHEPQELGETIIKAVLNHITPLKSFAKMMQDKREEYQYLAEPPPHTQCSTEVTF